MSEEVFTAKLKTFDKQKGFGFIAMEGQKDLFVHKKNFGPDLKPGDMEEGMTLSFKMREQEAKGGKKGKKGKDKAMEAYDVVVPKDAAAPAPAAAPAKAPEPAKPAPAPAKAPEPAKPAPAPKATPDAAAGPAAVAKSTKAEEKKPLTEPEPASEVATQSGDPKGAKREDCCSIQ